MKPEILEVAILGGGMAAGLLARQLKRAHSELTIGIFERNEDAPDKLGESMVELSSNYLVRRLGLSTYLYDRHLPKNGLRFFFDSSQRDLELDQMSEIGSESLPFHPAFQIDRARLDGDLLTLNAESGVRVRRGVKVRSLELGEGGQPHTFEVVPTAGRGAPTRVRARWVVDASGRARIIAKRKGLHVPETRLRNASVWGRFEGVADIDDLGGDAFRARVRYTGRRLSTLHFVHSGYWVWFIPLRPGITSIGVVCDQEHFDPAFRTLEGFLEFLRGHRAIASLIEGAKPVDHGCYTNLSYATKQFFSPDRWALVGDAAAFTDPFYSPGADFIALENDFVADLIRRDLSGEAEDSWRRRLGVYDEFMRFRFEAAQKLYRNQYRHLGSFDLNKLKWDFDVGTYYNLWVSSYVTDQHLDGRWVRRQLRQQPFVLKALDNFAAMLGKVDETLRSEGRYHEHNAGYHNNGHDCLSFFERELGQPRSDADKLAVTEEIFNRVRERALDLVGSALPRERWSLAAFMGDTPLI